MNKQSIRNEIKSIRNSLSLATVSNCSELICEKIICTDIYKYAENILMYLSINNEVDLNFLIKQAELDKKNILIPKIIDSNSFCAYTKTQELTKNKYGISEPVNGSEFASEKINLIIVPGIAFDKNLHRIGYGAGYYDKYLKKAKTAHFMGVCYDFCVVDNVYSEQNDVCLNSIVTEKRIIFAPKTQSLNGAKPIFL